MIQSECEPQPRYRISRPLATLGLATIALLPVGCSAGDAPTGSLPEAHAPTTEARASDQPEQTALEALALSTPEDQPYIWRGVAVVPGGTLYYDAPVDARDTVTQPVAKDQVMVIDQPRLLTDTDRGVDWFAFTLSEGQPQGLANSPQSTYWLPLEPVYQLGNPGAITEQSAVYRYPDDDPDKQCHTLSSTVITSAGNLALATDPSTLVATGTAMAQKAFDNLAQQKHLAPC